MQHMSRSGPAGVFIRAIGTTGVALVMDASEGKYLQAATTRKMEEESLNINQSTLKKLQGVIVLQDEGIIYCPIPKVNCFGPQSKSWTHD